MKDIDVAITWIIVNNSRYRETWPAIDHANDEKVTPIHKDMGYDDQYSYEL